MSYIGIPPQANFSSGLLDRFTSTTGTTVTLTHDIASENDIVVFVNFVKQDSTTYSVGGTGNKTLTLGGTLVSSDIVEVHYLNIVGQTNAPSSGSVGSSQLTTGAVTGTKLNTDVISAQTELATAPAATDELLVSDAGVLKRVDVSLVGGENKPSFLVTKTSNQSISNTTNTVVTWQQEVNDSDNAFASNKFTVPSGKGGLYFLNTQLRFNSMGDGDEIQIAFKKNGAYEFNDGNANQYIVHNMELGGATSIYFQNTAMANLSASDYIEVAVYHNNGGSRDINYTYSRFSGFKLIT